MPRLPLKSHLSLYSKQAINPINNDSSLVDIKSNLEKTSVFSSPRFMISKDLWLSG